MLECQLCGKSCGFSFPCPNCKAIYFCSAMHREAYKKCMIHNASQCERFKTQMQKSFIVPELNWSHSLCRTHLYDSREIYRAGEGLAGINEPETEITESGFIPNLQKFTTYFLETILFLSKGSESAAEGSSLATDNKYHTYNIKKENSSHSFWASFLDPSFDSEEGEKLSNGDVALASCLSPEFWKSEGSDSDSPPEHRQRHKRRKVSSEGQHEMTWQQMHCRWQEKWLLPPELLPPFPLVDEEEATMRKKIQVKQKKSERDKNAEKERNEARPSMPTNWQDYFLLRFRQEGARRLEPTSGSKEEQQCPGLSPLAVCNLSPIPLVLTFPLSAFYSLKKTLEIRGNLLRKHPSSQTCLHILYGGPRLETSASGGLVDSFLELVPLLDSAIQFDGKDDEDCADDGLDSHPEVPSSSAASSAERENEEEETSEYHFSYDRRRTVAVHFVGPHVPDHLHGRIFRCRTLNQCRTFCEFDPRCTADPRPWTLLRVSFFQGYLHDAEDFLKASFEGIRFVSDGREDSNRSVDPGSNLSADKENPESLNPDPIIVVCPNAGLAVYPSWNPSLEWILNQLIGPSSLEGAFFSDYNEEACLMGQQVLKELIATRMTNKLKDGDSKVVGDTYGPTKGRARNPANSITNDSIKSHVSMNVGGFTATDDPLKKSLQEVPVHKNPFFQPLNLSEVGELRRREGGEGGGSERGPGFGSGTCLPSFSNGFIFGYVRGE